MRVRHKPFALLGVMLIVAGLTVVMAVRFSSQSSDISRMERIQRLAPEAQVEMADVKTWWIFTASKIKAAYFPIVESPAEIVDILDDCVYLENLWIVDASITDEMACRLLRLPQIKECRIAGSWDRISLGSNGLPELSHSPVEEIDFSYSAIDDRCVKAILSHAPRLKILTLQATSVSARGFADHAPSLLEEVDLSDTPVDNAGVAELTKHTNLVRLDLSGTAISDKSIASLLTMKNLKEVSLSRTEITEDGIKRLKTAMPLLRVD